jgi:steroid 5-alpha reductase family enzyme
MATRNKGLQLSLVVHATVYAIVMVGLWRINQNTSPEHDWASIVAWGWGIGLAAHAAVWLMLGGLSSGRQAPR